MVKVAHYSASIKAINTKFSVLINGTVEPVFNILIYENSKTLKLIQIYKFVL